MNGHKSNSKRRWGDAVAVPLIGVSMMLTAVPEVQAATVATDFNDPTYQHGRQLTDHELAQLRGKAVNGRQVLFFGVEMTMNWKNVPTGEEIRARANLGIDMASGRPMPTFTTNITATTTDQYAEYQQTMANMPSTLDRGLSNGSGIVQLVQAGGDSNTANNAFWVNVGRDAGRGSSQSGNNDKRTERTSGGALVNIGKQAGGLGMTVTVPGAGEASQVIRAGRGLNQSIQLTSDHQQVSNLTRLHVQLGSGSNADISNEFKSVLRSVRSLEHL